ncbi:MAG: methionyl-tRNA formyltransferase [Flavobacterium sp.]
MEPLKIVFMGTPLFAVGVLKKILEEGFDVVGVVTAADKPAGRGQKMSVTAVKEFATEKGLKVFQPTLLKDPVFINELKNTGVNCQVVVAFRMLPEAVWKLPEYGTFNLHASLLPQYRGAAPINWAVINGETTTGVTTFFIDDKIDTGEIILSESTPIQIDENAGQLHDRLMEIGSELVIKTLHQIAKGDVSTSLQDDTLQLKTANKLNKDNCKIDWNKDGITIHNLIRGLSPYPGAWCFLKNGASTESIKIYESKFNVESHDFKPGHIFADKKSLKITVVDGWIELLLLQLPGKRKMSPMELNNGYEFKEGSILL